MVHVSFSYICLVIRWSATWDPQRRTVFGEHFNYDLLGFQHKCTACRDTEGKGTAAATSR